MKIYEGYSIQQYPKQNKIEITVPQTIDTTLTDAEEIAILMLIIKFLSDVYSE